MSFHRTQPTEDTLGRVTDWLGASLKAYGDIIQCPNLVILCV
jgi:hypothetical protein